MFRNRRKAFLVSAVILGAAMMTTACEGTDTATGSDAAQGSSAAGSGSSAAESGSGKGSSQDSGTKDGGTDGSGTDGSGADTGNGEKVPVEQSCGTNDITLSTRSETQAGGYVLIMAKAKPGITCHLPTTYPTVAFGSDGTEASPVEHTVGETVTLSGDTTAYAGLNPNSRNEDAVEEWDSIIVALTDEDPDPVSLPVDTIKVLDPVVTNWHASQAEAVPSA
ncbi:DUF4232 domain-containing protein [Streptomyces hirsutus]|uniref:hypothetical protein n=1 Tax=Streptomyces hirsutus TaxID=35620 RepID=UPI0036C595B1